jgi:hypothetical protein
MYTKNTQLDLEGYYPQTWINKMMLEAYGSERYYHFNPIQHSNWVTQ